MWKILSSSSGKKEEVLSIQEGLHDLSAGQCSITCRQVLHCLLASKGLKYVQIMTCPPSSPDLHPIENLWALLKRDIYSEGRQSTSLNSIWEAVVAASVKVDGEQIKKLTDSMDEGSWQLLKGRVDILVTEYF